MLSIWCLFIYLFLLRIQYLLTRNVAWTDVIVVVLKWEFWNHLMSHTELWIVTEMQRDIYWEPCVFIIARNSSCGKVMFLQACVCSRWGPGGLGWHHNMHHGIGTLPPWWVGYPPPPVRWNTGTHPIGMLSLFWMNCWAEIKRTFSFFALFGWSPNNGTHSIGTPW